MISFNNMWPGRMLKQSLFSPAQPQRAKTRLSPGFVLRSQASSTWTRPPHHSAARTDLVLLIRRTVRPRGYASGFDSPAALPAEGRVLARWGWVGETSELFEHPTVRVSSCAYVQVVRNLRVQHCCTVTYT
jgi:hypothetical protein